MIKKKLLLFISLLDEDSNHEKTGNADQISNSIKKQAIPRLGQPDKVQKITALSTTRSITISRAPPSWLELSQARATEPSRYPDNPKRRV